MATTCSILYYPGQTIKSGIFVGHVDLEYEGIVYTVWSRCQSEVDLQRRIQKTERGGLPFERFSIGLTSDQSQRLKEILGSKTEPVLRTFKESTIIAMRKLLANRLFQLIESMKTNPKIPVSYTCMDCVSNILQDANIIRIPRFVKLSPMISSLYIRTVKYFGNTQIKSITTHGSSFSSLKNLLLVNLCRIGEIVAITLPIFAGYYMVSRGSMLPLFF